MDLRRLMDTNVYSFRGKVLIAGACLPEAAPGAFERLAARADLVFGLCLEETHVNMAITKIAAILGAGRGEGIMFASVDRSPHCTQLHYIRHEIERVLPDHVPMESYVVAADGKIVPVPEKAVELSKSLALLSALAREGKLD